MTTPALPTETKPENAPAPDAMTLEQPIKRAVGDVTQITLRKPLAGELRGIKVGDLINGDASSVLALLPRITDPFITEQEAAQLDPADFAEIAGRITGFFLTSAQKKLIAQMTGAG
jgi:hypothetical protein